MKLSWKNKDSLLEGNILKGFVLFAIPLFLGSLFQQLYATVDLIFVGNYLGKTAAAAIGASNIIVRCFIDLFTGISVGAGVVTARLWGAREWENVRKNVQNALVIAVAGGVSLAMLGLILSRQALIWLHTPESIFAPALIYMQIYIMSIPAMIVYNMCAGILRAMGDSRTPFIVLALGGMLNVCMDALFIVVLDQGVAGTAIATWIAQVFTAVLLLVKVFRVENLLKEKWKIEKEMSFTIIRVGLPLGIQTMIMTLSNVIIQYYINGFGENTVAAFAVYFRAESFLYLPIIAFGQAMVTFTGQNYGAGNVKRIRKGILVCTAFSSAVVVGLSFGLLSVGKNFLSIFCSETAVIKVGLQIISVTFPVYVIYALMEMTGSVVRGLGKSMYSMIIVICNLCVVRVTLLAYLVPQYHSVKMVAAVYPISWGLSAIAFSFCVVHLLKRIEK